MKSTQNAGCWPEFMHQKHKYFDTIPVNLDFPTTRKKHVEVSSTAKISSEPTPTKLQCIAFLILKKGMTKYLMLVIWKI